MCIQIEDVQAEGIRREEERKIAALAKCCNGPGGIFRLCRVLPFLVEKAAASET